MKDEASARALAETMVGIGAAHGTEVAALLTDMNQPLGNEIGNATEIAESLDVLGGGGPEDLVEITYRLGVEMLLLGGITTDATEARAAPAAGGRFRSCARGLRRRDRRPGRRCQG